MIQLMNRGKLHPLSARQMFLVVACLWACGSLQTTADEADRIVEALHLATGKSVADVGAGDGEWSAKLAERVGDSGHVYATEVKDDELDKIRRRIEKAGLTNVHAVRGGQNETGLTEGCCDAILLRMVYHHFTQPAAMRASLWRALRPGGRIAIIDIEPQEHWSELPDVPDRGGHGIPIDDLIAEMATDGFAVVERHDAWNDDEERFCIVFSGP